MEYIGIDVGGTNLKAGLVDENGTILAVERVPLDFQGAESFAATLADLARKVMGQAQADYVGVGLPGAVDGGHVRFLIGTAPEVIRHYIELRGIGVIDVRQLFGMRTVKTESQLDLIVHLEPWDQTKFYDRLGIEDHFTEIMDVKVPIVTIPVRPGRNLASIVEVAALNNRHRRYGYNAAQELARRVDQRADAGSRGQG